MKYMYRSYNTKIVETPTYIEIYQYETPIVTKASEERSKNNLEFLNEDSTRKSFEEMSASEQAESLKRKQKHYEAMRWEIARLVDCNFDNKTKFVTLTFSENVESIDYANDEFRKFIQRLNYRLYCTKKASLKYLATWEKQKRGSIHYHVIFFNLPFIKNSELKKIWKHGFVKINKIDVDSKDNRGRYVSKYFSKDLEIKEHKKKAFFKSQNLKTPLVEKFSSTKEIDLTDKNIVYTNEYTQKVPIFKACAAENNRNVEFENRTVRYTKIKKE
ncbi:rolling circle replication-associated protein [Bacillus cereus]|uniref:rolling circle replication-associated protein n=1 Tax=Bacillus cereus TaxID=1396 RepID=UPI0003A180C6|nr:Rep protein [Bacillus cereus]